MISVARAYGYRPVRAGDGRPPGYTSATGTLLAVDVHVHDGIIQTVYLVDSLPVAVATSWVSPSQSLRQSVGRALPVCASPGMDNPTPAAPVACLALDA